jgi:hypothetical protein
MGEYFSLQCQRGSRVSSARLEKRPIRGDMRPKGRRMN